MEETRSDSSSSSEAELSILKRQLKQWEHDFRQSHGGQSATRQDADANPVIKEAYARYAQLKQAASSSSTSSQHAQRASSKRPREDEAKVTESSLPAMYNVWLKPGNSSQPSTTAANDPAANPTDETDRINDDAFIRRSDFAMMSKRSRMSGDSTKQATAVSSEEYLHPAVILRRAKSATQRDRPELPMPAAPSIPLNRALQWPKSATASRVAGGVAPSTPPRPACPEPKESLTNDLPARPEGHDLQEQALDDTSVSELERRVDDNLMDEDNEYANQLDDDDQSDDDDDDDSDQFDDEVGTEDDDRYYDSEDYYDYDDDTVACDDQLEDETDSAEPLAIRPGFGFIRSVQRRHGAMSGFSLTLAAAMDVAEYDVGVDGARDAALEQASREKRKAELAAVVQAMEDQRRRAEAAEQSMAPRQGFGGNDNGNYVRLNLRNRHFRRGALNKPRKGGKFGRSSGRYNARMAKGDGTTTVRAQTTLGDGKDRAPFHELDVDAFAVSASSRIPESNSEERSDAVNPAGADEEAQVQLAGLTAKDFLSDDEMQLDNDDDTSAAQSTSHSSAVRASHNHEKLPPFMHQLEQLARNPAFEPELYLRDLFGFDSFRPGQRDTVLRLLQRQSTLVVLSTGAGKSLCYQLPAYLFAYPQRTDQASAISERRPLPARRQRASLLRLPSKLAGACFHSGLSGPQKQRVMHEVLAGEVAVLFVAPETLVSESFLRLALSASFPPIAFACVDEAHCVSQWSHNFRPAYLRLSSVLRNRLGVPAILALTATATTKCIQSIREHLGISPEGLVHGSPVPRNLALGVTQERDRDRALVLLLKEREPFCHYDSVIVYCTRQVDTDRVALSLRVQGVDAASYHAGMPPRSRAAVQRKFMSGQLRVIVATIAFGMGLDKSDVRGVVHYNMPGSFENYVQEIGRAGRDGLPASCHAFVTRDDYLHLRRHAYADTSEFITIKKLLAMVFGTLGAATTASQDNAESEGQPKHPRIRAVCTEKVEQELDIRAEVVETILLQIAGKGLIELLPQFQATAVLHLQRAPATYCGPSASLLRRAILDAAAASAKQTSDVATGGRFTVDLPAIATTTGLSVGVVRRELSDLPQTRGDRVDFTDWSFLIVVRSLPSRLEFDGLIDAIMAHMTAMETLQLRKVQSIFRMLTDLTNTTAGTVRDLYPVAARLLQSHTQNEQAYRDFLQTQQSLLHSHAPSAVLEVDQVEAELPAAPSIPNLSARIREQIDQYFAADADENQAQSSKAGQGDDTSEIPSEDDVETRASSDDLEPPLGGDAIQDARHNIRLLISNHSLRSARLIAKVLQGIQTPCLPAKDWYAHPLWAKHLAAPFWQLRQLALEELISAARH
ncbi:hypothetical protein CAOG_06507 [Capsaspora owczarzaki ATCC 30864]|uniref:DNA 3'-5' helicase n=1 Tax=Capsaspora owczarzaki (strain ATCC 30864) TaxID=595528 RepID=A0A0D2VX27_CAPO3|nr:hypothetical protein CAOG_06507 [Capsaspora owczarzaki ATCC 30864]KJE96142.1 hypothetical protein CAOG_006507 [Capsaspora owczarzaki ATCC 30864]|eukprot:XP_004345256.2 hypothetical protein CAOG_06507 [Capsaspora owczarzaki ATCC 30864]